LLSTVGFVWFSYGLKSVCSINNILHQRVNSQRNGSRCRLNTQRSVLLTPNIIIILMVRWVFAERVWIFRYFRAIQQRRLRSYPFIFHGWTTLTVLAAYRNLQIKPSSISVQRRYVKLMIIKTYKTCTKPRRRADGRRSVLFCRDRKRRFTMTNYRRLLLLRDMF